MWFETVEKQPGGKMTRVYSSRNWVLVDTFRRVLESYGIASDTRGESPGPRGRGQNAGLWVLDDAKADRAINIIAQAEKKSPRSAVRWRCGMCAVMIEGQFNNCWQCGKSRS